MRFRLVFYDTNSNNKFDADSHQRHEYLGNRNAIWKLWFILTQQSRCQHVEVYNLAGDKQNPNRGIAGMDDYNI